MAYFKTEESPASVKKYLIVPNFEKLPLYSTTGSFAILPARLMGITYASYLRLCRDEYGAEVIGKGTYYPIPYFNEEKRAKELLKELENRVEKIL